ncbi:uncharacterized protein N7483_010061 [Penicillium malachiteum]|uniref:uncharacterized protein n=1 Tax=Penicillium malachiteum TaxID=1324776 RepID=UPI002548B861|nr:uncharacterized protein N7483_010061 [Penicillium malachiteum]KAJ5712880.1 hypothetical protein N7483_010061 [Penicillium malachiteum]
MTTKPFRFWDCSISKCPAASAIDIGACERCQRPFCALHVSSPDHHCDKVPLDDGAWTAARTKEVMTLRKKIQDNALLRMASRLNGGISCEIDESEPFGKSLMGGMHVHLRIRFSDGTVWLARILRENYTSFSDDFSNQVIESECATLKFLESINVPAPKLHGYGLRNDPSNEVGVACMLIDELPGTPLMLKNPSREQLGKVYDQWVDILLRFHAYPFDEAGALAFRQTGQIEVGPMIGDRTGTFSHAVDAYLVFRYLKQLAETGMWNAFEPSMDKGPFYLKHTDDKGDHIMVDDDYNITGIIDWTYARVVLSAFEAFGPSLLIADTNSLFTGIAGLSSNDKLMTDISGSKDEAFFKFAEGPDLVRRFSFGLGMGMSMTLEEAKSLWRGIISTATGIPLETDWSIWRRNRIHEWADDERLQVLLSRQHEEAVFKETRGICKETVCEDQFVPDVCTIFAPFIALNNTTHTQAPTRLATNLNGGVKCEFKLGTHFGVGSMMGCANYHAWLCFENGDRWIVRIPRTGFSDVPLDLVEYLVMSEYATLKFLESTNIPVPKPFAHALASDPGNRVGVSYILMQALPGKPFYAHESSDDQKKHVLEQLGDMLIEISKHPFSRAGSLKIEGNEVEIGPIASNRFVALNTYGPFDSSSEYLTREAFLFYHFPRQNIQSLVSEDDTSGQFFLKHVDDKGDHLLVDENFNITGIIDWQFSRTVPASEAFGPSYVTVDLTSLYGSNTGLTEDDRYLSTALRDKGSTPLALIAERNEVMRRFHNGLSSRLTRDEVREMLKGVIVCVKGEDVDDLDTWISRAIS